jgi:Tol biopolymer transport system component
MITRRLLVSVVFKASLAALFQAHAPAQPPGSGSIVYTHAPDGGDPWPINDIYLMTATGRNVKALTKDGHSHHPSWSPDGKQILYIHDAALSESEGASAEFKSHHPVELYVMDADGNNCRLLRRLERVIFDVALSPDGRNLAISYLPEEWTRNDSGSGEPVSPGVFLLKADAQGRPHLLSRDASEPNWAPDGKRLAFSWRLPGGGGAIGVVNADGSGKLHLTDSGVIAGSPAWSPDGKMIAYDEFVDQGDRLQVFVMQAEGTKVRQITTNPAWSCEHPSWSPDGTQLVFACRSAAFACGGVSSIGTLRPPCKRRLFALSLNDPAAKPVLLNQTDGWSPKFAPVR